MGLFGGPNLYKNYDLASGLNGPRMWKSGGTRGSFQLLLRRVLTKYVEAARSDGFDSIGVSEEASWEAARLHV